MIVRGYPPYFTTWLYADTRLISQRDCTWINCLLGVVHKSAFSISDYVENGHHQHRHWDNSRRLKQFQTSHIFMKQMLFCSFTCGISKVLTIVLLSLTKWLNPLLRRQQQQQRSNAEKDLLLKRSGSVLGAAILSSKFPLYYWHQGDASSRARSSHSPRDVRLSGSIGIWWKYSHGLLKKPLKIFETENSDLIWLDQILEFA